MVIALVLASLALVTACDDIEDARKAQASFDLLDRVQVDPGFHQVSERPSDAHTAIRVYEGLDHAVTPESVDVPSGFSFASDLSAYRRYERMHGMDVIRVWTGPSPTTDYDCLIQMDVPIRRRERFHLIASCGGIRKPRH